MERDRAGEDTSPAAINVSAPGNAPTLSLLNPQIPKTMVLVNAGNVKESKNTHKTQGKSDLCSW